MTSVRIFDRIASGEAVRSPIAGLMNTSDETEWRKAAHTNVRIVADEAAQHYWQSPREFWELEDGDFGALLPPFDAMWIEWEMPRMALVSGKWVEWPEQSMALRLNATGGKPTRLSGRLAMTSPNQPILDMCLLFHVDVGPRGESTRPQIAYWADAAEQAAASQRITTEEWVVNVFGYTYPGWLAMGWMNCRNIALKDDGPPLAVQRKRAKRGHVSGLDYKRIVVTDEAASPNKINRDAGANVARLHMVRGHFAHYTTERPLFGKVTGTFWRAWHVRGDEKNGRIHHEYHVSGEVAR